MFSLNDCNIPIDVLVHEILKFVSYYDLDDILPCFRLTPREQAIIKSKIYKKRLKVTNYPDKIEYHVENIPHREDDLPAIEYTNGDLEWWVNGKQHRTNGPAVERHNGTKLWFIHGKLHRENDLPAVEWWNGSKEWFINDKLHRIGGPAIECVTGGNSWWENGVCRRHTQYADIVRNVKL